MVLPFLVLIFLLLATPITFICDGPIVQGLVAAAAAISVATVAVRIRAGEAAFFSTVVGPAAIFSLIPAIWMLIQIIPLPSIGLAHPIWKSAAAALGQPIPGSISIDPGATLISLTRYLSAIAIALATAAVAVDRKRAEWILFTVTIVTALIALMALGAALKHSIFFSPNTNPHRSIISADIAVLGLILAAAAAFHTYESNKMQRSGRTRVLYVMWLGAFAICFLALLSNAPGQTYFAFICALGTLAATILIKQWNVGPWGIGAVISAALFVVAVPIAFQPNIGTAGLMLAFTTQGSPQLIMVTKRILAETSWLGTGAGTFAAVLPIFRDVDEVGAGSTAPTAAAAIAVEMGRPFLWTTLVATFALILTLLRGAMRRRRDSVYSAAGAGCVVAVAFLAFGNSALLSTPVAIIIVVIVGIAVAQRKSRVV